MSEFRFSPSFAYKTSELLRRWKLTQDAPQWRFKEKLGGYELLDQLGVPHAGVHATLTALDQLRPEHLREPVVLKPLHGNGSSGVVLLEPDGAQWVDRLRRRRLTFDELVAYERRILQVRGFDDVWLLEEPLTAADRRLVVPDDFKVYAFQGEIGLIVQRRGWPGSRYKCYDQRWRMVDTHKHEGMTDGSLDKPGVADAAELLEVARRVSQAFPFPFCRIDGFLTDRGVAVGELNPWVGGYKRFDGKWDRMLGELWELAELRSPDLFGRPAFAAGAC